MLSNLAILLKLMKNLIFDTKYVTNCMYLYDTFLQNTRLSVQKAEHYVSHTLELIFELMPSLGRVMISITGLTSLSIDSKCNLLSK